MTLSYALDGDEHFDVRINAWRRRGRIFHFSCIFDHIAEEDVMKGCFGYSIFYFVGIENGKIELY